MRYLWYTFTPWSQLLPLARSHSCQEAALTHRSRFRFPRLGRRNKNLALSLVPRARMRLIEVAKKGRIFMGDKPRCEESGTLHPWTWKGEGECQVLPRRRAMTDESNDKRAQGLAFGWTRGGKPWKPVEEIRIVPVPFYTERTDAIGRNITSTVRFRINHRAEAQLVEFFHSAWMCRNLLGKPVD